ncbi:MAG: hypothetical protein KA886_11275 [Candidatus Cloacimonetes bacterium]|nr:hypothetical protein [Candidatus Cloacimonadota bacterium]
MKRLVLLMMLLLLVSIALASDGKLYVKTVLENGDTVKNLKIETDWDHDVKEWTDKKGEAVLVLKSFTREVKMTIYVNNRIGFKGYVKPDQKITIPIKQNSGLLVPTYTP